MSPVTRCLTRGVAFLALSASLLLNAGDPLAHYTLTGDFSDSTGSGATSLQEFSSMETSVVTGFSADGWFWQNANKSRGLKLGFNTAVPTEYTIAFSFSVSNVTSYIKVMDFVNLSSDMGLYLYNGSFTLYQSTGSNPTGGSVLPDATTHLLLTRNNAGLVSLYQNGSFVTSLDDTSEYFKLGAATYLFHDDRDGGEFSSSGTIASLKLWDHVLGQSEITQEALSAIPEASTTALLAGVASLGALLVARRKRQA